jgi:hypothetical protein
MLQEQGTGYQCMHTSLKHPQQHSTGTNACVVMFVHHQFEHAPGKGSEGPHRTISARPQDPERPPGPNFPPRPWSDCRRPASSAIRGSSSSRLSTVHRSDREDSRTGPPPGYRWSPSTPTPPTDPGDTSHSMASFSSSLFTYGVRCREQHVAC